MQALTVYRSRHWGNTKEVAEAMAEVLEAELRKPEELSSKDLEDYDLVGFGSGIYFRKHGEKLLDFAECLPEINGKKAFIISTSGLSKVLLLHDFEGPIRRILERKGFEILDSFDCGGGPTFTAYLNTWEEYIKASLTRKIWTLQENLSRNWLKGMRRMIEIYTDGASRGNPGPASHAFIILEDGDEIDRGSGYIGKATNNRAEYTAVIEALERVSDITDGEVKVYSDSNLLVRQLSGDWKIKSGKIQKLHDKVKELTENFEGMEFVQVPRENKMTQMVDRMCNEVLDEKAS